MANSVVQILKLQQLLVNMHLCKYAEAMPQVYMADFFMFAISLNVSENNLKVLSNKYKDTKSPLLHKIKSSAKHG